MKYLPLLLLLCYTQIVSAFTVTISAPAGQTLSNEPIVLQLDNYTKITPKDRSKLAVFVDGKEISSQLDDLNGDKIPDELVFLANSANNTLQAKIKLIKDSKRTVFDKEVYAEMLVKQPDGSKLSITEMSSTENNMYNKMHHHGVAWESTLSAYRIYFDNKSTIDVYDKKTPQLELAACQWYPNDEQLAKGFGDDVLIVSGSVGVGAVKPWNGKKALHIDKFDKRTQRIVSQGNLRTICETEIEGWQYEGKKINMIVRYIQYARHRDCMVEVRANTDIDTIATGVQKVKGGRTFENETKEQLYWTNEQTGCLSSLGNDWPVNDTIKYAKEQIGLGVIIDDKASVIRYTEDKSNNLVLLRYKKGDVLHFRITEISSKTNPLSVASFQRYIEQWQAESAKQIVVQ